jgi:hypothetical protein
MGIFLLLAAFVLPQVALAVETQPCRFWGTVKVNGNWVADGTLITAWIDGAVGTWSASTYTAEGKSVYFVDVPADNSETTPKDGGAQGDTVRFKVRYGGNDYVAAQIGVWAVGDFKEVNLEVSLATATLSGQPLGLVNYRTADITVAGTGVVAYKYKLDSGNWGNETAVSTQINLLGLGDGAHTVYVIGKDAVGNWQAEAAATTASWTVDATPPTATLSGQPTGVVNYNTANVTVGGTDVVAYKYKLDASSWGGETAVGTHIGLSGLGEGSHTVSVIGKDTAGNWQAQGSATTASWTIETTLPTITVARDGIAFSGTATDASSFIASVKYQLDGGGWINATASDGSFNGPSEAYNFTLAAPPDGTHTVEVKATDAAGNFASQSLSFSSRQLFFDSNEGWNSVAYLGSNKPVSEALGSIWDKLTVVWFYDNQNGTWHGYNPHVPSWANDLSGLVNGQSYWIRVTSGCYWTYGG